MKHLEFYTKYKTDYPPFINPVFNKKNWWQLVLLSVVAVLIEPLNIYKQQRTVPFSLSYYLQLLEYCFLIFVPYISFFLWLNWRESIKRSRGYGWLGRFEVVNKQSSLLSCYFWLSPGNTKLKVERGLFEKTRIGNFILIRRDALGNIEEIRKVKNLSRRLAKTRARRFPKGSSRPPPSARHCAMTNQISLRQ